MTPAYTTDAILLANRISNRLAPLCDGGTLPDDFRDSTLHHATRLLQQGGDPARVESQLHRIVRKYVVRMFGVHLHIGRNRATGTETAVIDPQCQDFDAGAAAEGHLYGALCITHTTTVFVATKGHATDCARNPLNFCDDCRAAANA